MASLMVIAQGPKLRRDFDPAVVGKLLREGLVVLEWERTLGSQAHTGNPLQVVRITEAGRQRVARERG